VAKTRYNRFMASWPPYQLIERDYLREAQEKYDKLERLYHVGFKQAWDGKKVLGDLLKKHGGVRLPREKKQALAQIFSTILWGELAAWSISADLALQLDEVEAKMAATSQVFDEARHFYTMRDYLLALDVEVPPLDGYTHTILTELLDTRRLVDKLLGMQLIVESVAVTLFKSVAQAKVEPVLSELMPYFERDEARHVGLGVLYLPKLLADIGPVEAARLKLLQLKIVTLIGWGTHLKKPHFETLGMDNNEGFRRGMRLNREVMDGMRSPTGEEPPGVLIGADFGQRMNDWAIDLFFPRLGAEVPAWQRMVIGVVDGLSRVGDKALRMAA
jgi:hypothetical protein